MTATVPELLTAEFTADPYPAYERMLVGSPARCTMDGIPGWAVTRYEDVRAALDEPRLSTDGRHAGPELARWAAVRSPLGRMMLSLDPPDHTRLRWMASAAFTRRRVDALRPRLREIADGLVAGFAGRSGVEVIDDYALPLALTVLTEMLGIPPEDHSRFVGWVNVYSGVDVGDRARVPEAVAAIADYLTELIGRRVAEPDAGAATGDGTLFDVLIAARDEAGDRLTPEEIRGTCALVLIAGYETTANLIANGLLALLRNPDQLALLRVEPHLLETSVDELVRYDGPARTAAAIRYAVTDVPLGGSVIPAGEAVFLFFGATGRDPARWPDPDRLDLRRDASGQLGLGHGPHYCLGVHLARAEAAVGIGTLLTAFPDLALPDRFAPVWRHSRILRAMRALPLVLGPSSPAGRAGTRNWI